MKLYHKQGPFSIGIFGFLRARAAFSFLDSDDMMEKDPPFCGAAKPTRSEHMNGFKKLSALFLAVMTLFSAAGAEIMPLPVDLSPGMPPREECFLSDTLYEDESIRAEVEETAVGVCRIYIARVSIADPSQLRTMPAKSFDRDRVAPILSMIRKSNAVMTLSGDYFSYQKYKGSYLVRQGVTYMTRPAATRDILIIDDKGDFYIEQAPSKGQAVSVEAVESHPGIVNTFNFGPGLVVDGVKWSNPWNPGYCSASKKTRRVAICQVERGRLDYICVCCDGREVYGGGLTLEEFADFVYSLGVENAYNLDGGNSAAFFLGEKQFNHVSGGTRDLSDIIYFASAVQPDRE